MHSFSNKASNGGRKRVKIGTDQKNVPHFKAPNATDNTEATLIDDQQHTTLENLAPFANYSIMISAETEEGEGPFTHPTFCTTQHLSKKFYNLGYISKVTNISTLRRACCESIKHFLFRSRTTPFH